MFDLGKLNSFWTMRGRLAYARRELHELGKGSSRAAFEMDGERVLKLAMNRRGLAQNAREFEAFQSYKGYPVFAKTLECSEKCEWLVSELAGKATLSAFNETMDNPFVPRKDYLPLLQGVLGSYCLEGRHVPTTPRAEKMAEETHGLSMEVHQALQSLSQNPAFRKTPFFILFSNIYRWLEREKPDAEMVWDLTSLQNWGIVERNGVEIPVVVDYGTSSKIMKDFY